MAGLVNMPLPAGNLAPLIRPKCLAAKAAIAYLRDWLLIARIGTYTVKNFPLSERSSLVEMSVILSERETESITKDLARQKNVE